METSTLWLHSVAVLSTLVPGAIAQAEIQGKTIQWAGQRKPAHAIEVMKSLEPSVSRTIKNQVSHATSRQVRQIVLNKFQSRLKGYWKSHAQRLTNATLQAAEKNGLDPLLVLAVIETESQFRPEARGSAGEIGLMQIKPTTAEWIAGRHGIEFKGHQTLLSPEMNIAIGAAYIGDLRGRFNGKTRAYVGAYNVGTGKMRTALKEQRTPRVYSDKIFAKFATYYQEIAVNF
jgi:soluble lytic murein transglycosylase-like protein